MTRSQFFAAVFAMALGTTASTAYDGKLAAEFNPGDEHNQPSITYYDARCSQDERPECVVTYLVCEEPQMIGFSVLSVEDAVLGKWLVKNGGAATLKNGGHTLMLTPVEMTTNDMDGGWDLTFRAISADTRENAAAWFATLPSAPSITISTVLGDDVLPADGDNGVQLNHFLAACRGP